METTKPQSHSDLKWLDTVTRLMDNQFRIPGTSIRFGFDVLIGLIPGIGDMITLGIGGLLVVTMVRKGASGMVVVKMIGNIILDALVGVVPVIGDIFDVTYKSNRRNMKLLREHYVEGAHQGSAWPVVIAVMLLVAVATVGMVYLIAWVLRWYYDLITTSI